MYKEKFAKRLKELIDEKSVRSVAKQIGIHHQTLHKYINCQCEIGLEMLIKIADYFSVDLDYLTGRKDY